jgi:hypothetical protein
MKVNICGQRSEMGILIDTKFWQIDKNFDALEVWMIKFWFQIFNQLLYYSENMIFEG